MQKEVVQLASTIPVYTSKDNLCRSCLYIFGAVNRYVHVHIEGTCSEQYCLVILKDNIVKEILLDSAVFSSFITMATALWARSLWRNSEPKLFCKTGLPLNQYILKKCPRLTRTYSPTFWARNAHLQTILPAFLPRAKVKFDREIFMLRDGSGSVALDWTTPVNGKDSAKSSNPVLIILPPLGGGRGSSSNICQIGTDDGFRCVVFNKRGHGGNSLLTPKYQSMGDPSDLREVVLHIRNKFPDALMTVVGYSRETTTQIRYLADFGSECHLAAAVMNSPGYDAEALGYDDDEKIPEPYSTCILRILKSNVRKHQTMLSSAVDINRVLGTKTPAEFEEALQCKMHDFKNMEEYCKVNNAIYYLPKVSTPTLLIHSEDDPVFKASVIPFDVINASPYLTLALTKAGGHLGFLEGFAAKPWADKLAVEYLRAVLDFSQQ